MVDLRRISVAACLLIVVLRMAIGWQFLYEGLWKLDSQSTATPWSAEGYLRNAQGPFRDTFRRMTGDPEDKRWTDFDAVNARWIDWKSRFLSANPDLTDSQKRQLDVVYDGPKEFSFPLEKLPEGVEIKGGLAKVVRYDAKGKRLVVDAVDDEKRLMHLIPKERDDLLKLVAGNDSEDAKTFENAIDKLYEKQAKLAYRERLVASLKGDPGRAGLILNDQKNTIDFERMGDIKLYRQLSERYERLLRSADVEFKRRHLDRISSELEAKRAEVVGPVKALEKQLHADAYKILTAEQLARGPVSTPNPEIDRINTMTIWSLIVLGALLIAGLGTRPAAFLGAGMVFLFYLPMPPWPGVPEPPGPEHSFIVNKNLIEVFALLAIAFLPTGQWFGVDRWFQKLLYGRKSETPPDTSNSRSPDKKQEHGLDESARTKTDQTKITTSKP